MAKERDNTSKIEVATNNVPYIAAAAIFGVVMILNMILVNTLFERTTAISTRTSQVMENVNQVMAQFNESNAKVLLIAAGIGDRDVFMKDIELNIQNVQKAEQKLAELDELPELAKKRYSHAKSAVNAYLNAYNNLKSSWARDDYSVDQISNDYTRHLQALHVTAGQMIQAITTIVGIDSGKQRVNGYKTFYMIEGIIGTLLALGELLIFLAAKFAKRSKEALAEREKNLAEVDAKLKNTRQKANDLAVMNILTGMKNRYALDNDVSERLETDRFNVAVFDLDNFRSINDTYGYDFGDEYLASVAEKLKEEFNSIAEIYNITGNEFCFLFNRDVSENQAMVHAQKIQETMSGPYDIMNLTVQLTASGAVYHYLPGDCLNVNSLLVKLDTAMRSVKMNGGNMITSVMNI
jgi:diguanylate cyclase (GGDEF)-like protein